MPPIFTNNFICDYPQGVITMDSTGSLRDRFRYDGFIIVKNLFNPEEIDRIREDAQYIFSLQMASKGYSYNYFDKEEFESSLYKFFKENHQAFINCGKHIQHLISLHRLSLDGRVIEILNSLGLSFPNICTRPVLYFNTKHLATKEIYHTMPAHQDQYSMEGSDDSTVVWVPLIDVTKNLGTLQVVPRSHTEGLVTIKSEEGFGIVNKYKDNDFISIELSKGDALFFSSCLVHRSGINITDSIRWSSHFRYNNMEDSDFIKRQYPHPYIYKPSSKIEPE